jgi:nucleoid-associated protein YgaU
MTVNYADKYGVEIRVRRRRRKIAGDRRARMGVRVRRVFLIICICAMTGVAGYISVQDSAFTDTGLAYAAHAAEETHYINITVHRGDTLWDIAGSYSEPSDDIREVIREISLLNDIESGNIYPGQIIQIPVGE